MKTVLICTRKNKGPSEIALERAAAALYRAAGGQVVRDEQLPWLDLKAVHGNFENAVRAVGSAYDILVVVEEERAFGGRTLGKGQYALAVAAKSAGKTVVVARPGETKGHAVALSRVQEIIVCDTEDWKTGYAKVLP
jgi:hypothetical protein